MARYQFPKIFPDKNSNLPAAAAAPAPAKEKLVDAQRTKDKQRSQFNTPPKPIPPGIVRRYTILCSMTIQTTLGEVQAEPGDELYCDGKVLYVYTWDSQAIAV